MRAIIDKYAAMPFSYGADCCQFVGECVEAVTGTNPAAAFRYTDEASATELIASYGTLAGLVTAVYGQPYDGHKDGDITVHDQADGTQVAGVVYRGESIVRTKAGLMNWPLTWARGIWET